MNGNENEFNVKVILKGADEVADKLGTLGQALSGETERALAVKDTKKGKPGEPETEEDTKKGLDPKKAKEFARMMDPTQAIISGLKSGDMKKAMGDWAASLGTQVASTLMSTAVTSAIGGLLSMIPGIGGLFSAFAGVFSGQRGLYTGEYQGPALVHPHEIIAPLDTVGAMASLMGRAMAGVEMPAPAPAGGTPVRITVDERAGDLVDVHRAESVERGSATLDTLEGVST